jgi:hypothetical protein
MKQQNSVQYMDVKEVSEVVDALRGRTMQMIGQYKTWHLRRKALLVKSSYLLMEDDLLREQIHEMFRLYRQMHREYHALYRRCMAELRAAGAPDPVAKGQEERRCA